MSDGSGRRNSLRVKMRSIDSRWWLLISPPCELRNSTSMLSGRPGVVRRITPPSEYRAVSLRTSAVVTARRSRRLMPGSGEGPGERAIERARGSRVVAAHADRRALGQGGRERCREAHDALGGHVDVDDAADAAVAEHLSLRRRLPHHRLVDDRALVDRLARVDHDVGADDGAVHDGAAVGDDRALRARGCRDAPRWRGRRSSPGCRRRCPRRRSGAARSGRRPPGSG